MHFRRSRRLRRPIVLLPDLPHIELVHPFVHGFREPVRPGPKGVDTGIGISEHLFLDVPDQLLIRFPRLDITDIVNTAKTDDILFHHPGKLFFREGVDDVLPDLVIQQTLAGLDLGVIRFVIRQLLHGYLGMVYLNDHLIAG